MRLYLSEPIARSVLPTCYPFAHLAALFQESDCHTNHSYCLMLVKLTNAQRIKVSSSNDIFCVMQPILLRKSKIDRDKEHFWVIGLDNGNTILYIDLVSIGSCSVTIVDPVNVFRVAVLKGAARVALCHNHPSDQLTPSEGDKRLTDRMIQVGRIINVDVFEHLIITSTSFLSFVDIGLYQELGKSFACIPPYQIAEQIRREEKKLRQKAVTIAKEQGFKKGKKEGFKEGVEKGTKEGINQGREEEKLRMAKSLKYQLVRETIIANASGLPIEQIEALPVEPITTLFHKPVGN